MYCANLKTRKWHEEGRDPTMKEFFFEGGLSDFRKILIVLTIVYGGEFLKKFWKSGVIFGVGILIGVML